MNDHMKGMVRECARRIAWSQRKAENSRMDELERSAIPLFLVMAIAAILFIIGTAVDAYADSKHAASIHNERIFALCMSGEPINAGDGVIRCSASEYKLTGR